LLFGADYDTMILPSSTLAWRHKNAVRVFVWWVMIERVMNTTTRWRAAFYLGAAQIRLRRAENTPNERPKPVSDAVLKEGEFRPRNRLQRGKTHFLP